MRIDMDGFGPASFQAGSFTHHFDYVATGTEAIDLPDAEIVFSGTYTRTGNDLVISRAFEKVTIHDYFKTSTHATLKAPNGASLHGDAVVALTHSSAGEHYAGNTAASNAPKAIGRVETVTGAAAAIRNGETVTLHAGDLVYKGDSVETGANGTLAITFLDGTAFNLSANARMVLNDMVYEPGSASNSSLLSIVQGSISFVAGDVAHTGKMDVETPVATMGIRGTAVHVDIGADNGTTRFSVLREPSGRVGKYSLYDRDNPDHVLAVVDDAGTFFTLRFNRGELTIETSPKTPVDLIQEQALTNFVFQTFQAGQQNPLLNQLEGIGQPQQPVPHPGSHGSFGPPEVSPPPPSHDNSPLLGNAPTSNPSTQPDSPPLPPPPLTPPIVFIPPKSNTHTTITPIAVVETIQVSHNGSFAATTAKTGLLQADSSVGDYVEYVQSNGGLLTAVASSGSTTFIGQYGELTVDSDGTFQYIADRATVSPGQIGTDTFTYTLANSTGGRATGSLTFNVDGGTAANYKAALISGTAAITTAPALVSPEGGDHFAFLNSSNQLVQTETGLYGTASIDAATGVITYTYTASQGVIGTDTFTVVDTDALGATTTTHAAFDIVTGASSDVPVLTGPSTPESTIDHSTPATSGSRSVSGTFGFTDADPSATHTVTSQLLFAYGDDAASLENGGTFTGPTRDVFTASLTQDSTGGAAGQVTWTDSLTPDQLAALGSNIVEEVYAVTITNGSGGSTTEDVVVNLIGPTAPTPPPHAFSTFNGASNDYVSTDLPSAQTSNLTLAGSFLWDGAGPSTQLLFYEGNPSMDGFGLYGHVSDGALELEIVQGGDAIDTGISISAASATVWHAAALTYGPSIDGHETVALYVDGAAAFSTQIQTPNTPTGSFEIGGTSTDPSAGFLGSIGNVSLWNSVLTPTEINELRGGNLALTAASDLPYSNLAASYDSDSLGTVGAFSTNGTPPQTEYSTPSFYFNGIGAATAVIASEDEGYFQSSSGSGNQNNILTGEAPFSLFSLYASSSVAGAAVITGFLDGKAVATQDVNLPAYNGTNGSQILLGLGFSDVDSVQITSNTGTVNATNYDVSSFNTVLNTIILPSQAADLDILNNLSASIPAGDHIFVVPTSLLGAQVSVDMNSGLITYDPTHAAELQNLSTGAIAIDDITYAIVDNATGVGVGFGSIEVSVGTPSINAPSTILLASNDAIVPLTSDDGAALQSNGTSITYDPTASSGLSALNYGQSELDHFTYMDSSGAHDISFTLEGVDHGPQISSLTTTADVSVNGGVETAAISIGGTVLTGSDDEGTIQYDAGGAVTPFMVSGGSFSFNSTLAAGDHVATLTMQDDSGTVSGITTRQIDIDVGGHDAPAMTSSTGGPAILIGSANPAISQTITGSPYADTLVAGAGNDVLTGNGGGDTFVFKPNMGNDTITDLLSASGAVSTQPAAIDLTAFHIASYQALLASTTDTASGAVIALGSHTLTLDNVHVADLYSGLFHL